MRKKSIKQILRILPGLVIFALGVSFAINAGIGLSPWDAFAMGLSYHLPLSFGMVTNLIAIAIMLIDLILKEKIGLGTLLDAVLTGTFVDVWQMIIDFKTPQRFIGGAAMMVCGMIIISFGQYLYMSAALSCGPRDLLMVAIGKRFPKAKISLVNFGLQAVVMVIGALLGAKIGAGTVIALAAVSAAMQIVFGLFKFEPRDVSHDDLLTTLKHLTKDE